MFVYYNTRSKYATGRWRTGLGPATFVDLGRAKWARTRAAHTRPWCPDMVVGVEPGDPFSSLDFLHGWWSEMPIPLNERNNERACRREDVREWEGPQTCPAHMGPDTRLADPHGATTRRAFRTGTRSGLELQLGGRTLLRATIIR